MGTHWIAPPDLAALRCRKGLSLWGIAETTKISIRYLEAIERGQFAKLPGGVYTTSYLRQYARAVECDEAALLEYYYGSSGSQRPGCPAES